MPTLETLSLPDISGLFTKSAFSKARNYKSRVTSPVRKGSQLTATVMGRRMYKVEVMVDALGIHAACTCPYEWTSYCKHIGALLLCWIESPYLFRTEAAEPTQVIAGLEVFAAEIAPPTAPEALPVWMTESFADQQARAQGNLTRLLEMHTVATLRQIAARRGWRLSGARKADLVAQMLEQITSVGETAKAIYSLDQEHQRVLRALALHSSGNLARKQDVKRTAQCEAPLHAHQKIGTYTHHLSEAGLAFPPNFGQVLTPPLTGADMDFVPFALAQYFPPLLETVVQSSWEMERSDAAHVVQMADPLAIARAVQNLLLLFEQEPPRLRPPQPRPYIEKYQPGWREWTYIPDEVVRLFAQKPDGAPGQSVALTVPPPAYALEEESMQRLQPLSKEPAHLDFLYALMVAAGLLQTGSPVTPWPQARDEYLTRSAERQHAALVQTYFRMNHWTELWEVQRRSPDLQLKRQSGSVYLKPQAILDSLFQLRHRVLRFLAYLPDNRWVQTEDVISLLRSVTRRIRPRTVSVYGLVTHTRPWSLTWQGKELDGKNPKDWMHVQGAFFAALLRGPLYWLGLADLVLAGDDVHAFRLHGLADLYWERVDALAFAEMAADAAVENQSALDEKTPLSVGEMGRIRVEPGAISAAGHNLLRRIARVVSSMVGLFVYRLDLDVVYETFESGLTLDDLVESWQTSLPVPMPPSVRSQLEKWWHLYGQVRIYRKATLIEFGDDFALTEMKAATSLDKAIVAELSPRLVLIDGDAVAGLVAQLEKAGYTPKLN